MRLDQIWCWLFEKVKGKAWNQCGQGVGESCRCGIEEIVMQVTKDQISSCPNKRSLPSGERYLQLAVPRSNTSLRQLICKVWSICISLSNLRLPSHELSESLPWSSFRTSTLSTRYSSHLAIMYWVLYNPASVTFVAYKRNQLLCS